MAIVVLPVSIHAPVWGRTVLLDPPVPTNASVSIHAPVWGRTATARYARDGVAVFQSTPPCGGERCRRAGPRGNSLGFNPRPRVGANTTLPNGPTCCPRFQSTPPCGGERHV